MKAKYFSLILPLLTVSCTFNVEKDTEAMQNTGHSVVLEIAENVSSADFAQMNVGENEEYAERYSNKMSLMKIA